MFLRKTIFSGIPVNKTMMYNLNSHQEKDFRRYKMGTFPRNGLKKYLCQTKILTTTWMKMIADLFFFGHTSVHKNNKEFVPKAHYVVCDGFFLFFHHQFSQVLYKLLTLALLKKMTPWARSHLARPRRNWKLSQTREKDVCSTTDMSNATLSV